MQFARRTRKSHSISLTPLIDVMFCLVLFFMVSTSFVLSESLELSLPSGKPAAEAPSDVMQLLVRQDGTIVSGKASYSITQLDTVLMNTLGENPDQKILLLSGQDVTVQQLVSVMDLVYLNGGRNVQIDQAGY